MPIKEAKLANIADVHSTQNQKMLLPLLLLLPFNSNPHMYEILQKRKKA